MTEPTALAKILDALRNWPIWFILSIVFGLALFLWAPAFSNLAAGKNHEWALFAFFAFLIMSIFKICDSLGKFLFNVHASKKFIRPFFLTFVDRGSFWHLAKQPDGSIMTQISLHFTAKNLSDSSVHLLKAEMLKPKIKGEVVDSMVLMKSVHDQTYGTTHTSGNFIPARTVRPITVSMMVKGVPREKNQILNSTFLISDAGGNSQKIKVKLKAS